MNGVFGQSDDRLKYQRLPCIGRRPSVPPVFSDESRVRQYELSDCGMVIEIELRQFPIKALITLTSAYSRLI